MLDSHAQVGIADADPKGHSEGLVVQGPIVPASGYEFPRWGVERFIPGIREFHLLQVGLGFDLAVGDHVHTLVGTTLDEPRRGDAKNQAIQRDDLQYLRGNAQPRS